ncbi:MAG: TonB C-terminal domain-containing protein [Bdellovibrionales bacterium]|nr:TonB C-terminal domain-containing protein [Bdellovibrionales bacterium]
MKEPQFTEELSRKIRGHQAPVPPPPRQLVRKAVPSYFKKGIRRSFAFHGGLIILALVQGYVSNHIESAKSKEAYLREQVTKSAIRVDIVDLPSLKLDDLAKVDATEDIGAVKPNKAEPEPPKSKPSETAMIDRTQTAKAEEKKKPEKKKKESALDRLKALRDTMRVEGRRQELMKKLKGDKEGGRPMLGGNVLSEGDSTSGDVATVHNAFVGKIKNHIRKHWSVPGWMTTGKFQARVVVKIAPDGRVLSFEFEKKSGNDEYDANVKRSIESSNPFPPPPPELKVFYMEEGLKWEF